MRRLIAAAALLAVCLIHTTDVSAQLFGSDSATGYEALRGRILARGETTVIVRLDVENYRPEGRLRKHPDRMSQRARIKSEQEQVLRSLPAGHARLKRQYQFLPYLAVVVDLPGLEALSHTPGVTLIQPDLTGRPALAESRLVVKADVANAAGCDGSGWAVAVLDTGVELAHDAFAGGKIVSQACYSTNDAPNNQESMCPGGVTESTAAGSGNDCAAGEYPGLICPHGTLVAGVAAGDGGTIVGIAPQADIIAIRIFTKFTDGADCPGGATGPYAAGCPLTNISDLMAALERVATLSATMNIAAINISADFTLTPGGPSSSSTVCDNVASLSGIKDAVDLTNSLGIPSVAATGNQGKLYQINPPSCLSNVISVGSTQDGSTYTATTVVDSVMWDSNRGTIMDFWAPGEWITSSFPNNTTLTVRGTSVAAPHVAGALAALRSKGTASDPDYYVNLLRTTGVMVTDHRPNPDLTKPRIDVGAACAALSAISLDATVLLEGPYLSAGSMSVHSAFADSVPLTQPFGDPSLVATPIAYSGSQAVTSLPASTVDWVLVELRTGTGPETIVAQQPAFLTTDGSIVDPHGGPVGFVGVDSTSYYVVIRQRNHAAVMSSSAVDFSSGSGSWDFTTSMSQAYPGTGAPMKDLGDGNFAMFAGDSNVDGYITALDFTDWIAETTAGATGYQPADYNLDGNVTALDFTKWIANTTSGAESLVPD
jgi:hypothetical protein